jgi:hypothetical protein
MEMFGLFKKKDNNDNEGKDTYDPDKVTVHYEGEVLSADYTADTLVLNEGGTLRRHFNDQGYPYHTLHPHGKGKLTYRDGDTVLEEYEGEFEAGQYHGKGTLVDRHGEILEGNFVKNRFKY